MKVAVIGRCRKQSANGVDRTIIGHISQLIRLNHDVVLFTFDEENKTNLKYTKSLGIEKVVRLKKKFKWMMTLFANRKNFDLVCLHSVFTPYNWFATLVIKSPWIITPNGGYSPGQIRHKRPFVKKAALMLFEKRTLDKALFVHAVSKNEEEQIKALSSKSTVRIAPNGCDLIVSHHLNFLEEKTKTLKLLFIGRIAIVHKGLDILIDSLAQIETQIPWSLDIVGVGSESETRKLVELVRKWALEEKVHLKGAIYGEEKFELLRKSDIFVHTSRWEGMPFSVVEALQYRIPVLITPETNMGDLVADFDAGWVVEADNLRHELGSIFENVTRDFNSKSVGAENLVKEKLSWDSIGNSLFSDISNPS